MNHLYHNLPKRGKGPVVFNQMNMEVGPSFKQACSYEFLSFDGEIYVFKLSAKILSLVAWDITPQ